MALKVLHIIDSLDLGGAEQLAVHLCTEQVEKSWVGLVATRKAGPLQEALPADLPFWLLNKKRSLDGKALKKCLDICKQHKVSHLHCHSTSIFFGAMLKLFLPRLKLIWHDHYGNSEFLEKRPTKGLKLILPLVSAVVVVNERLKNWLAKDLGFKKPIHHLNNFSKLNPWPNYNTQWPGNPEAKRLVCLANLRPQKDHPSLIHAFSAVAQQFPQWHLFLMGKDFQDDYSEKLKALVRQSPVADRIHIMGSCLQSSAYLKEAHAGVLPSKSEGLPLSLLEYGLAKIPVLCTQVGEIPHIFKPNHGWLLPPENIGALQKALQEMMEDEALAGQKAGTWNQEVESVFGPQEYMKKLQTIYQHA